MPNLPLASHLLAGGLTFVLFWGAALSRKGGPRHRAFGRRCFLSLVPIGLSVGAILILRRATFDPAQMTQFIYLLLCLTTIGVVGWTAIRWKAEPERFRGRHFRILGPALFASGLLVLVAGTASHQPLAMILSSIGLVFGGAMIRFTRVRRTLHPRWWLGWHLNAVLVLSSAVHGTLLAVLYRSFLDPQGFHAAQLVTQPGTLLFALALRVWIGKRRGVPLRFTSTPAALAPTCLPGVATAPPTIG